MIVHRNYQPLSAVVVKATATTDICIYEYTHIHIYTCIFIDIHAYLTTGIIGR